MSSARAAGLTCMTRTIASATPTRTRRSAHIALWVLQVLTAAVFVFAAIPKVTADPMAVAGFAAMGIGTAGMHVIGILEIAGAIALFIPRLAGLAGLAFVALMIGAVTSTLVFVGPSMVALPAVVLVASAVIAYGRRRSTVELVHTVRRFAHR
jgi:uncharacterized membrane protein